MPTHAVRHITATAAVPLARAYALVHRPESFARWAAGLASTLHETPHGWVADTPQGEATVTFSPPNAYGVLDHRVRLPGRPEVYVPLRLIANGDGTEVTLTLLRQPDMDDAAFDRDAETVAADLARLCRLLEAEA